MLIETAEPIEAHSEEFPIRNSGTRVSTMVARAEAVERVIREMREHPEEPMSLENMAATALLSPYHFNRIFSEVTGVSPNRFLAALRFEAAKRLLLTTERSVTDICFEVGYNSLGTFTSHFTEAVGVSPRALRRVQKEHIMAGIRELAEETDAGRVPAGPTLEGWVSPIGRNDGPVFVGIFTTSVPQGRPARCTVLEGAGPYRLGDLSDGTYHAFAAAFPWSRDPLAYLLPRHSDVYVGTARSPIVVTEGTVQGRGDIKLRSLLPTDPPMLVALPVLIAQHSQGIEAA